MQTIHAHSLSESDATDQVGDAPPSAPYTPPFYSRVLSAVVAFGPPVLLLFVIFRGTGGPVRWWNIALAVAFVVVIGHAVTVGFHRLFTHRSFVAKRPLKIALAIAGSMSFQGSMIGWVADHRRHHRYSDRAGDPHSPWVQGDQAVGGLRGLWHAHIGWCFTNEPTSRTEFAPDLLADPDLVFIDKLFVPCCVATLALPFAIGYVLYGTLAGAVGALLLAGILRIGFSHNVTWAINSVCHRFGRQPFRSHDQSRNVAGLALFSMGESWHNAHHAFPRSARHGVERHQLDSSAVLIRLFERLGWATNVRWPDPVQVAARRVARPSPLPVR
ncbi:MAG: acyl-CoA desaturase [Acidimicrobiia bacterium]